MPRKCTICHHPKAELIDKEITKGVSLRQVALRFSVGYNSVFRHSKNCRQLDIGADVEKKRVTRIVDAYDELAEQLALAKALRDACRDWLQDPTDPLRLRVAVPTADEVEIIYLDWTDTTDKGEPRKKTAQLSTLLEQLQRGLGYETIVFNITGPDIRKLALDCIYACDKVLDKIARIDGSYRKKQPLNADVIEEFVGMLIEKGWEERQAREFVRRKLEESSYR